MAKEAKVVSFGEGPNQMDPGHQRMVVDQLLDHLGVEVWHIAGKNYEIRNKKSNPKGSRRLGSKGN